MNLILSSQKPKIFLFGACDLLQAVNIDTIRKEYTIDAIPLNLRQPDTLDFNTCIKPKFSTSMVSLYTKPNELANRIHEYLSKETDLKKYHYSFYREIVKYPYLKYFKESAGPNDILIMNFSSELYTKMHSGSEKFTVIPAPDIDIKNPADKLHWLYTEYLINDAYQVPFDDEESLNITYDLLQDFAKEIHKIFNDRVILVKTHVTDLTLTNDAKIEKIPVALETTIPFYKPKKIMSHPLDHTYAQRATNLLLKKFRKWYSADIPVVAVDDVLFVDVNHPHGYAPFHLHYFSNYKIGINIYQELVKMSNRITKQGYQNERFII
jgi:hypothetical protein